MKRIFILLLIPALALNFTSCQSDNSEKEADSASGKTKDEDSVVKKKVQKVFYALPSPFELASLIKYSGVDFRTELLNSPENFSNYSTSRSQALNLGVYGVDLGYSLMFGQTQHTMVYVSTIKKLTEKLGVTSAFDAKTMERLDANKENEDSLQQIISDAYFIANAYLKENDRVKTSTLILVGSWIEGLYLASQLRTEETNERINNLIAEQKYSLDNIVGLLESYENGAHVNDILEDLTQLRNLYEQAEDSSNDVKTEAVVDTSSNSTEIGGESDIPTLSPELMKAISEEIATIRNKYTS